MRAYHDFIIWVALARYHARMAERYRVMGLRVPALAHEIEAEACREAAFTCESTAPTTPESSKYVPHHC